MGKMHRTCRKNFLIVGFSILVTSSICRAETLELVTYYPAGGAAGGDQQDRSLRVGGATGPAPGNGVAVIQNQVAIGVPAPADGTAIVPAGVLEVRGAPDVISNVNFSPGADNPGVAGRPLIRVGIGTETGTSVPLYALDVVGSNGANQSIYSHALDGSLTRLGLQSSVGHWSISNYGRLFAATTWAPLIGAFAIADENPGGGVRLLIMPGNPVATAGFVGIGTTGPQGVFHVVGAPDAVSNVIFSAGVDNLGVVGVPRMRVGIETADPQASLQVGASSLFVQNDQGGNIELGGTGAIANPVAGGMPYIDFHFGRVVGGVTVAQDFNTRLINRADGILDVQTSTGGAAAQTWLSVGNNIGMGTTTPQTMSPQNNVNTGNLDANDVFLRSTGRWMSQVAGTQRPDATGIYVGNGAADRLIPLAFRPARVLVWVRHDVNHIHTSEFYVGLPLVNADGVNEALGGFSLHYSETINDVRRTWLRIVAGQDGFRVGGGGIHETNWADRTYRWMAWR